MKKILVLICVWLFIGTVLTAGCFESGMPSQRKVRSPTFDSISWNRMSVANKATFVGFDENSYLDDYGYLASVPASVFYDRSSDTIFSNPLLYYNDPFDADTKEERTYNDFQGLDYFMQDFTTVAGNLDVVEYINMDQSQITNAQNHWGGNDSMINDETDPYNMASKIALTNWEYSDTAVLVPIEEEYKYEPQVTIGKVNGSTPNKSISTMTIKGSKQPNPVAPNDHDFEVEEGYKYINALMIWGEDWEPEMIRNLIERGKDPDMQLYDKKIGQVAASENWNPLTGPKEEINSYAYNAGEWKVAVTYMPTEEVFSLDVDVDKVREELKLALEQEEEKGVEDLISSLEPDAPLEEETPYTIDLTMYPGVDIPIPDRVPFSARNIEFTLESKNTRDLGLIILGPSGAEIASDVSSEATKKIELSELGIGEHKISVVNLGSGSSSTDFTVSYKWEQTRSDKEGLALTSAGQGAVLGSMMNAPLLYTRTGSVPAATKEALNKLGVRQVSLVNLDRYAPNIKERIEDVRSFYQTGLDIREYKDLGSIYTKVKHMSAVNNTWGNDVVFSTINPWDSWIGGSSGPEAEHPKALYLGPGAYAAAFHGTPLIIPDIIPEISCSQTWHNIFWKKAFAGRGAPSVACMILTGERVYEYMNTHDLDVPGVAESILTVAGQFDIGTAWDRMFTTVAYPGRIMGTPVDTAYWISRSAFYPYVIYANPAVSPELDQHDGKRIVGSSSTRIAGKLTITEPEREEVLDNPILESWVSYQHRFNELAADYWGCPYTTRTGITPYYTDSPDPIDAKVSGGNYPDITTSEIVSEYSKEGNFGEALTTNFDTTMENLNRGVIMWYEVMHGGSRDGGIVGFWNTDQTEPNPWRGYEENGIPLVSIGSDGIIGANPLQDLTRMRGCTENPDVVTMSKYYGLDIQPSTSPKSGLGVIPETHDGVIIAILQQGQTGLQDGYMFDDALDNIYSVGFSAGSCLIANTYLHLTMMRHGSVFQIIDPWLTSWYSSFAMEMFAKDQATGGYTVGESYVRGITHVGIQYLVEDGGWWDIFENLVYYGDPDIVMFTPNNAWEKPVALEAGTSVNGHNVYGAGSHPYEMGGISTAWIIILIIVIAGSIGAGIYIFKKRSGSEPGK